jgi:formylglycine-generating enzyme required for sulfatase activity
MPAPEWLMTFVMICSWQGLVPPPVATVPPCSDAASAREWTNSLGIKLVLIPPGKITMGSPVTEEGRVPDEQEHEVEITRPFYMGAYEVTVGQFRKFVEETNYRTDSEKGIGCFGFDPTVKTLELSPRYSWRNPGWEVTDQHPVVNLSWNDAQAFCAWLGKKEGKIYRLPTEAEWEYACRAGAQTHYAFGDDAEELVHAGNVTDASAKKLFPFWTTIAGDDGHAFTAPVGSYRPNAFGLYDTHGNAAEWCADWYVYAYPESRRDPAGPPSGIKRVTRGGCWADYPLQCQSAHRAPLEPDRYTVGTGLRVALDADPRLIVPPRLPQVGQPPCRRLLGGDVALKAAELTHAVAALTTAGRPGEALGPARDLLALRMQHQGTDHWQVGDARRQVHKLEQLLALSPQQKTDLSAALVQLDLVPVIVRHGQPADARTQLDRATAALRQVLGMDHPLAAAAYQDLARLFQEGGMQSEAVALNEQALAICMRLLGPEHPETIRAYRLTGKALLAQKEFAEAEKRLRQAASLARIVLGDTSVDTAGCYDDLARSLKRQNRADDAQPLSEAALDIYERIVGREHSQTVECRFDLAVNLLTLRRYAEAEAHLCASLDYYRRTLGPNHPQTVLTCDKLAGSLFGQHKYDAAEPFLRHALASRRQSLGDNHPLTVESQKHLLTNLRMQGKTDDVAAR